MAVDAELRAVAALDVVRMELDDAHRELLRPLAGRKGLGSPFWAITQDKKR